MIHRVVVSAAAKASVSEAFLWIAQRSEDGAVRWLDGIEAAIRSLNEFPSRCPLAPEAETIGLQIRQHIFGKRNGRYRILFIVRDDVVHIIEVRHGARRSIDRADLQLPPGTW